MKVYGVIMAGGVGSRLWPESREYRPKQFIPIFSGRTLIQRTFDRLAGVVPTENIFVVTGGSYAQEVTTQLPDLVPRNLILEPVGRNTAPCIAAAAASISSLAQDPVMVVLPSDHLITDEEKFTSQLNDAIALAETQKTLVTIGITPTYPETGFGYIHFEKSTSDRALSEHGGRKVIAFKEKPDLETAIKFLESGDYLWNSGMFVWRVDVILAELNRNLVHFSDFLGPLKENFAKDGFARQLEEFYLRSASISIDYAVMEKAQGVLTIPGTFGWSDVGSWDEVYRISDRDRDGNSVRGHAIINRGKNNLVWSSNKLIAVSDVDDIIVIETENAILICKRGKSQSVKEVVEILRKQDREDLI